MNKTISFKISRFAGDLIHWMAGIQQVCHDLESQADIYLWLNQSGACYEGATHPYNGVMLNDYAYVMLKPLLMAQPYVNSVLPWNGEPIIVDLDKIQEVKVGMPYGSLSHWIGMKFPDMQADLSQGWFNLRSQSLDILEEFENKIIVNRTTRYLNHMVSYFFLNQYKENLVFVGLEDEHKKFCEDWKLEIPHYIVRDFHHLAQIMNACKFFIGNQSMCFAIAEGLKIPRILEMCPYAPNIFPIGSQAHYFNFQEGLTYLVDKLNKEL